MQMLICYLFASRREKKKKNLKNIFSLHGKLGKLLIQLDQTDFTIKMTYYLSGHFILSF